MRQHTQADRPTGPPSRAAAARGGVQHRLAETSTAQRCECGGGDTSPRQEELTLLQRQADGRPGARRLARLSTLLGAGRTGVAQRRAVADPTGLGASLRAGLERLSGLDLSGIRVRTNSPRPAQLAAHAFAQGREIHVAPGQERHLGHEGWHAVQQLKGQVRATTHLGSTPINDDPRLEREADVMGARAMRLGAEATSAAASAVTPPLQGAGLVTGVVQGVFAVAQLVKMYNHTAKLYVNDEDNEPAPDGYATVSKYFQDLTDPEWTTSPPAASVSYEWIVRQMLEARQKGDAMRFGQLKRFVENTLGAQDRQMAIWRYEQLVEEQRLMQEAPDDRDYYLDKMENPKSHSDYALGLMVRGVPGAGQLLEQYETSTGAARYGFQKQIDATAMIDRTSGLTAVEQNQSEITRQRVFVSADIVTRDERGDEMLVEVKYWPGLMTWSPEKQQEAVQGLIDQLIRYVRTGKKVQLLWLADMPVWLAPWLEEISRRSFGNLQVKVQPVESMF